MNGPLILRILGTHNHQMGKKAKEIAILLLIGVGYFVITRTGEALTGLNTLLIGALILAAIGLALLIQRHRRKDNR